MNNIEYGELIQQRIDDLEALRKIGVTIAAGVIGESLLKEDLYYCASIDRCLNLIDGFVYMVRERNLTCAGALLRLEMDNCMRIYAAFIAEDKEAVIDCMINGNRINKQKSKDGKKLEDTYLKQELSKYDSRFEAVYNQANGYIHLSSKAFYQTVVSLENYHLNLQIGRPLPEKRNPVLIECTDAFIHFVKLHYKMLNAVVESKKRFDADYEDTEGSSS